MASSAPARREPTSPLARAPSSGLVLGAIASVQLGSAIAAKLFDRVGPSGAVLLRLASATILLGLVWRPPLRLPDARTRGLVVLFGLALAGMNLSFYAAIDHIPLGVAVTVEFVGPLSVAVLGSHRRRDLGWAALAALGIAALVHRGGGHVSIAGLLLALLAGGFWAAYILLSSRLGQSMAGGTGLALACGVAALVAVPFGISQGGVALLRPSTLAVGAAVGVLSTALPSSLEMEALRRITPSLFGVLMSLEPAAATLAGLLVLGQSLGPRQLLGVGLVVCASLGATLSSGAGRIEG